MKRDISKLYELVGKIDEIVICYPDWSNALKNIRECIAKTPYYRESVNSLLLASTGAGKTTICNIISAEMRPFYRNDQEGIRRIVPAFYCEIPCPTTIKSLASAMLQKLADPSPNAGNAATMTKRLIKLLKACETQIVMFDELHNIFDLTRKSKSLNLKVVGWLKNLINESNASYCLVGTPVFEPLLLQDKELARRFKYIFDLKYLTLCSEKRPGTLKPFLVEACKQIKNLTRVNGLNILTTDTGVMQMYAATRGNPSFIMAVIKEAILLALLRDDTNVTLNDFVTVIDTGITSQCQLFPQNPFRLTKHEVQAKLGAKKNVTA
jgi:hypothetical protein